MQIQVFLNLIYNPLLTYEKQIDPYSLIGPEEDAIKEQNNELANNVVEEMTLAAGLPKVPDVYIIDEKAPNAFATGRNPKKAAVAVTVGLLEKLNREELQGVIAHELAHIKNRDTLYMLFTIVMLNSIIILSDMFIRSRFRSSRRSSRVHSRTGSG